MVTRATAGDLDAILTVQKLAFLKVAEEMQNLNIPPLTQTIEDIKVEFSKRVFLKYELSGRIVGSVRAHLDGANNCQIGKLVVLPEYQNKGLGKELMRQIEQQFPDCGGYELFTGEGNGVTVSFYSKLGYLPVLSRVQDGVSMVYMRKENR
ncbi:GNAT family N-acetyltransferase [Acetanaerobacterium elongatum]|uniref:Acetyltransferase (GNAT) domain-containing protein n=1 Tax=Acetanaerobacterium elongatum TaxID=258515 RepID=A0A1H0BRJ8_9FIRM|nr:GNAT family N-acetyltransferase [Acetanaerobacterium elongatum]SDN48221.1 Acetyltransferase (GNAT) domain-containing protein [Acetanaerobacterium elongatum]